TASFSFAILLLVKKSLASVWVRRIADGLRCGYGVVIKDGKIMPFKMTAFHPCFVANKYGECRDRGERSSHNSLSVSLKLGRQDNAVFQLKTAFAGRCKPHPPPPSPLRGEGSRAKRDGGEVRG